ncbi:MAG: DUF4357 domain-containing protein [Chloroflexi bacterium]|nr:DUF4357 domain-containing protein [Chloroflexota bacterium]
MVARLSSGFEDGFLDLVEEQLNRCRQKLIELDKKITGLQEERADEAKRIVQLEGLLRGNRSPGEGEDPEPSPIPPSRPRGPIADADAVVELIRESGGPMHYLEIHETLVGRGFEIGGKGNAATLLSRYSKDPRLSRVARGTYDIVSRYPDPSKGLGWSDRGETVQFPTESNRETSPLPQASHALSSHDAGDKDTFELSFVGLRAMATYLGTKQLMVLRGSQARKETTALGNGAAKILERRERLIRDGVFKDMGTHFELTEDTRFDNPSSAAKVMSGAAKNGWVEWKTPDGRTLDDVHRK